jgi:hypothetical protein
MVLEIEINSRRYRNFIDGSSDDDVRKKIKQSLLGE